jgi:hypothetical protein
MHQQRQEQAHNAATNGSGNCRYFGGRFEVCVHARLPFKNWFCFGHGSVIHRSTTCGKPYSARRVYETGREGTNSLQPALVQAQFGAASGGTP